jgi:outer membrane protein OmpA-like peptidoglycan-associated protein
MPLMNSFTQLRFWGLVVGIVFNLSVFAAGSTTAPKKDGQTIAGNKAYAKLKFSRAIGHYNNALAKGQDTIYLQQRIAACYGALNDQVNAEKAYAGLANNANAASINKYYYAELLRVDKNYASARKYYEAYANTPGGKGTSAAVQQMDKIPVLAIENTAYKVSTLNINTAKSDYAPVFYTDGKLIFSSNRSSRKAFYDKWAMGRFSRLYVATLDSTAKTEMIKLSPKARSFESSAVFSTWGSQIIFSTGSFKKNSTTLKNGMRLPVLNLYSAVLSGNAAGNLLPLSVNGDFSNAHPSISKDGKTLYFASDRLGGQGGTDIYVSTLNANGVWGDPQNLGDAVNTAYDEKFPFIADDGTLYFASNAPYGLGGLDIYKTTFFDGHWRKPQNLGAPINSSYDDFSLIIDAAGKTGFFASNRPGGKGEDDIYKFTYDGGQLDYNVKIRVLDVNTLTPLVAASLSLDCQVSTGANTVTDENGEKVFTLTGGKSCIVEAWSPGYKNGIVEISPVNANGMLIISLEPDSSNPMPVPSANPTEATAPVAKAEENKANNAVAAKGHTHKGTGAAKPMQGNSMYVPISSNCMHGEVTVAELKTGSSMQIAPDASGESHFDLKLNTKYVITHGSVSDTISTKKLRPGDDIVAGCTYHVGNIMVVPNVYYNVNRWNIRPDAAVELDRLATIMQQNPSLQIELTSHTDCRASSRYNMVLSARRAKAAVDYLVRKGIKIQRIIAVGYGESQITNGCVCEPSNYSPCTEAQHQENRKTEVKVLRY